MSNQGEHNDHSTVIHSIRKVEEHNDLRWHIGAVAGTRPVVEPSEKLPKTLCKLAADPESGRTLLENSEAVYYSAVPGNRSTFDDKIEPMWCRECLTVHRASQDPFKAGLKETKQAAATMSVTGDQLPEPISPAEAIDTDGPYVDEPPFETLPETVPVPASRPLTVHQLLQLGATQPEGRVTSAELKAHLTHQEQIYNCYSKEELVAELVRRDAGLIRQGQEAADGKMAGRLLREFVRGILYSADQADLSQTQEMLAKGDQIDSILRMLGAEPAPKRDLRVNGGTTLGPIGPVSTIGQSPEDAIQDLSDLSRRQFPSERAANEIRNRER